MLIETAVEEFYFRNRSLSVQTQIWYTRRLNIFHEWCKQRGIIELEQLNVKVAAQYLDEMAARNNSRTNQPLSSHTRHGHARILRTWFNWLETTEEFEVHIQPRIGKRLPMPKVEKHIVSIFSIAEIKRLFAACDDDFSWPDLVCRNKAILALLLDTGIRAGELCSLTIDHCYLNDDPPYLKVLGKGSKEREVGVGRLALAALQKYLQYRLAPITNQDGRNIPAHLAAQEKRVFISLKYTPLTTSGLRTLLIRLGRRAGVEDTHPHRWRHTYACLYLLQGGDIHLLSRLMGHTDTQITSNVYLSAVRSIQARQLSKSVLDHLV